MPLIGLVVISALALVALGFFAPRQSRRLQGRLDRKAEQAKAKAESQPKLVRNALEGSLELLKRSADRATEAGREGHHGAREAEQEAKRNT